MGSETLMAWTAPAGSYPAYFNASRDGDDVVVTVRAAPLIRDGFYLCAHQCDAGPGRCVVGGPTCNNYCNMAPEKGPMRDSPLGGTQTYEGEVVTIRVPTADFAAMLP